MEKTIILTGPQGSGKTFLSEIIEDLNSGKKILKTDFHEIGYTTNVFLLRTDLVIIEEVPSKELPKLLDRIKKMIPYIKRTHFIIICQSIPELKKNYTYTEIKCSYNQKII
jgi:broad-specificity NMP kinase